MNIQENYSLKNRNTFGVDVCAKHFAEVSNLDELVEIISSTQSPNNPNVLFLGGGSNILLTKDFDGLVIQLNLKGISEEIINENEVLVTANSGENWHEFVQFCLNKNYGGLENLSLIPGNVGTSPMQNIGAYGTEIFECIEEVEVCKLDGEIKTYKKNDL